MEELLAGAALGAIACFVAFFTAMGGVTGAYLMIPAQAFVLGTYAPVISATNVLYNLLVCPPAIYRYHRERRFLWPLAITLGAALSAGAIAGACMRAYIFVGRLGKIFIDAVLTALALILVYTAYAKRAKYRVTGVRVARAFPRLEFEFSGTNFSVSLPAIAAISALVGVVAGAYGIGGGAFMSPILQGPYMLPAYVIAAATLFGTLCSSVVSLATYAALGVAPSLVIGALMGLGGLAGAYLGAATQRRVPERLIRLITAAVTLAIVAVDALRG